MRDNKTVTINGRIYDAVTGLPIEKKAALKPTAARPSTPVTSAKRSSHVSAAAVHATTQRSQTLNRRATKKPGPAKRPQPGTHMDIARSGAVSRFAAAPVKEAKRVSDTPDIAHKDHPAAVRASAKSKPAVPLTTKQVKEAAIAEALAKPKAKPEKKKRGLRWSRRFTIVTACFAVLILGAFFTYTNIPSLSVSIAAAQAGISATYPEYRPDGYGLSQPVIFKDGEVTLEFKSNNGNGGYTIVQSRSSWDSSAVLDNVVRKAAGDNYITTQERGLTIYSYESSAVWVNGGILYTIHSEAPLSGEQIRHIATSL